MKLTPRSTRRSRPWLASTTGLGGTQRNGSANGRGSWSWRTPSSPPFLGLVLLGSFARGEADDLSDVDFIVFSAEGDFDAAWEQRHRLHPADASCWDYPRPPGDRDVAGHRWLTPDFVLFDGLIAAPSGTRLADSMHVLVGDEILTSQIVKRESITDQEQYRRKDEIALHEVEMLYGRLKLALRAHRSRSSASSL